MTESTKSLRSPLTLTVGGKRVKLLTIGYVASALGRTNWTVRYYEQIGLMPPAAFVLNKETLETRRRLYVEEYVEALAEIARQDFFGERLEYEDWKRFRRLVCDAYKEVVEPLLPLGVTPPLSVACRSRTEPGSTTVS